MEIYLKDSSQPYQFWLRVYSKIGTSLEGTLKFCYHKLMEFNLDILIYNYILFYSLLHLQLHLFDLVSPSSSILLLNLSCCISSSFVPVSLSFLSPKFSKHVFNRSANFWYCVVFLSVVFIHSSAISSGTLLSIVMSWTSNFISWIMSNRF